MTGAKIQFDVVNDTLSKGLANILDLGRNPEAFLDEIGGQLVTNTQDRFDVGVGPDGDVWEPSQRAIDQGGLTLKDDGNLSGGITHDATGSQLVWGSNEVYAAIHQFGGETGRNKALTLPARPYIGLDARDEQDIEDTFAVFFGSAAGA